MILVKQLF